MPRCLSLSLTAADDITLALGGVLLVLIALMGHRAWRLSRVTPEQRERLRREVLVAHGKMGDATLMEVRDDLVLYCYHVRGMEYTAAQDISLLKQHMPSDLSALGSVSVKYDARNPANSIVLAERWSGLRARKVS